MPAYDITVPSLISCFLLLAIPFVISRIAGLGIIKESLLSVSRMLVQLLFVGLFLTFLFDMNNVFINLLWLLGMVTAATYTTIRDINMNLKDLFAPTILSFLPGNFFVLIYFNLFVIDLENLFNARYLIPIFGMFLGNSLRGNIVGISDFYSNVKRNENRYLYSLSLGAKKTEALMPYIKQSLLYAIKPSIASMSTLGIVTLPGMMTGQIIAGSSPVLAIKYQMAIMVAIYVSTVLTVSTGIYLAVISSFDEYGLLRNDIFRSAGV